MNLGYLVKHTEASWCEEEYCWEFSLTRPPDYEEYHVIAWEYLTEKEKFDE